MYVTSSIISKLDTKALVKLITFSITLSLSSTKRAAPILARFHFMLLRLAFLAPVYAHLALDGAKNAAVEQQLLVKCELSPVVLLIRGVRTFSRRC
jgi:hypothetical protein